MITILAGIAIVWIVISAVCALFMGAAIFQAKRAERAMLQRFRRDSIVLVAVTPDREALRGQSASRSQPYLRIVR